MADANGACEPGYTRIPNELFDIMPSLSEIELRTALFLYRKTWGWHKESDSVSLSQIVAGTGLTRQSAVDATESLNKRGIIAKTTHANGPSRYTPLLGASLPSRLPVYPVDQEVVYSVDQQDAGSLPSRPEVVYSVDQEVVYVADSQKKEEKKPKETRDKSYGAVAPSTPPDPPEPSKSVTKQQAEVGAWASAMGLDVSIPANASRIGNMLKGLRRSKVAQPTTDVAETYWTLDGTADWNYYRDTWQGQRGQPPTEREINQYWGAWLTPTAKSNGHARAAPNADNRAVLERARARYNGQPASDTPGIIEGKVISGTR